MQIKEFEAFTLKDCLQKVRQDLGADAVILETRKFRKGGILGWGARDAVRITAAIGITVQDDLPAGSNGNRRPSESVAPVPAAASAKRSTAPTATAGTTPKTAAPLLAHQSANRPAQTVAAVAARSAYARANTAVSRETVPAASSQTQSKKNGSNGSAAGKLAVSRHAQNETDAREKILHAANAAPVADAPKSKAPQTAPPEPAESERRTTLERMIGEIRDALTSLQREQREGQERTVTAVVSAVAPAVSAVAAAGLVGDLDLSPTRFPELYERLVRNGVSETLAQDLLDSLPDLSAWSEEARPPLAESALRDLLAQRLPAGGEITLTPGKLKAVALIGPTGVGKTTTIAKLAAHFSLVENKRVALLTVDTYRIAAVEQLKTYSQIIDIPIGVAYSPAEVVEQIAKFADYDLLLIDTAGRSHKNIMQVGELKSLLESFRCETHLVLSAQVKESDMLDAAQRFSAARVDRLLFTKLDETGTHGTILNVADKTGIPLSYFTTGQKVPEDIETADAGSLADTVLA